MTPNVATDLMPFGKHKGTPLKDVPKDYFSWLKSQDWLGKWPRLAAYIDEAALMENEPPEDQRGDAWEHPLDRLKSDDEEFAF